MNKYIVIYHATAEFMAAMAGMSAEQMAEGMKPWMTWAEASGEGLVDMGTPLGGGLKLSSSGSVPSDRDVTGYSIIQAENMAAAEAMMQGHPHLMAADSCSIEIHEAMPLPGM
jgi:hypothetical protein